MNTRNRNHPTKIQLNILAANLHFKPFSQQYPPLLRLSFIEKLEKYLDHLSSLVDSSPPDYSNNYDE